MYYPPYHGSAFEIIYAAKTNYENGEIPVQLHYGPNPKQTINLITLSLCI